MMAEVDYVGVRSFVALILAQRWEPRGSFEYIRLSMLPEMEPHLPKGITVDRWGFPEGDDSGMVDCRLRRVRGWRL